MDKKDLIKQARRLLSEATPGPWVFGHMGQLGIPDLTKPEDGEFIAFARNHLGEIIDSLQESRERVERQERALDIIRRYHWGDGSITREQVMEQLGSTAIVPNGKGD